MKRVSRDTLTKKGINLMIPIDISKIGSVDDPCFGKLYDGNEKPCQRCGDSELCIIAMGQNNHSKRKQIESKNRFKDIEPEEFKPNTQQIYKFIKENLFPKKNTILLSSATKKINKEFRLSNEMSLKEVKLIIRKIAKQAVDMSIVKREEKRYLKLKQ